MRVNRKGVTIGLLGLAMVGAVGAGGIATAATASPPSTPAAVCSGDGAFGNGYGMAVGSQAPMAAAATYLGVSQAELQIQLHSGKSLADVARAQGRSVTRLQDAMVAAVKVNLDANNTLTAAQKTARQALIKSEIATMVTEVHAPGDGGGMRTGSNQDAMAMGTDNRMNGDGNGDNVGGMRMHGRN